MPNIGKSVTTNIRGIPPLPVSLNTGPAALSEARNGRILSLLMILMMSHLTPYLILYDADLENNIKLSDGWLVVLGLTALSDSISVNIGPSPREREKEK